MKSALGQAVTMAKADSSAFLQEASRRFWLNHSVPSLTLLLSGSVQTLKSGTDEGAISPELRSCHCWAALGTSLPRSLLSSLNSTIYTAQ